MLDTEGTRPFYEPVHRTAIEAAGTAQAIGACHAREQFQVDFLCESAEGTIADIRRFMEGARLEVMRDEANHLTADVEAVNGVDVQPVEQRQGRFDAGLLMIQLSY